MRIVQVCPYYWPHTGGVESHVRSLVHELARLGQEVTVVTARHDPALPTAENDGPVRVLRSPSLGTVFNTPLDLSVGRLLRTLDPDVAHLHYPPPITPYFAARALAARQTPTCLTYHCDLYLPTTAGALLARLYDTVFLPRLLSSSTEVVVHTRSYGLTSANLRNRPFVVIPSLVDLRRFRPGLPVDDLRERLHLGRRRVLVFTGRLVPHKGIDVLLYALAQLPEVVTAVIVGRGPWLQPWVNLARRLGVLERVRFCPGVSEEELPRYLALGDLFVYPSQNRLEGFGLVVAEAMATGLPVVIADLPGVREVIRPGVDGLLTEPLIPDDLAAKVQTLLEDEPRRRRMSVAARQTAEARYDATKVATELLALYERLAAGPSR